VEDLSKREKDLRHFVDINDPSRFYIQRGNGLLHFKENGYWKTIDFKLKPTLDQGVFHSEFYLNDVDFNRLRWVLKIDFFQKNITQSNCLLSLFLKGFHILLQIFLHYPDSVSKIIIVSKKL
jgi:hypothetical protein